LRLVSFRAYGFRSMEDSGLCYVAADITVLAGKNESGKTNVLKALELLNLSTGFDDDDVCHYREDVDPTVCYDLRLTPEEIRVLSETCSVGLPADGLVSLRRSKSASGPSFSGPLWDAAVQGLLASGKAPDIRAAEELGARELVKLLPTAVYFDSFTDMLPDKVRIADISTTGPNRIVHWYCSMAGMDYEKLHRESDKHKRQRSAALASNSFMGQFREFWSQEDVIISISCDGEEMLFIVADPKQATPFRPSQRSQGFRWFTSFFLSVAAQAQNLPQKAIILIDEPGLYLHARAQEQVLGVLEKMASQTQVVFATHSPFLLDPEHLDRIRLVLKDDATKCSRVQNNALHGADEETLTPLIAAIGLNLARSWGSPARQNVVVEGAADYYYLTAMRDVLKVRELGPDSVSIVPCVGHTKAPVVASILIGWGLEVCVLLDDKGTRSTRKEFSRFGFPDARVAVVGDGLSMEDLVSRPDFETLIGEARPEDVQANSEWAKRLGDKVALGLKFRQKCQANEITPDQDTKKAFRGLFDRLVAALKTTP
jgi:hypothetical protein